MIRLWQRPSGFLSLIAILVAACVAIKVNTVWKDQAYQARPNKVMVVGVAKNPANRRIFEDEFVQQLNAHGTKAIASYTVLSDKQQDDNTAIAAKVKELGADTMLITRVVGKKNIPFYVPWATYYPPAYYEKWPDYYGYQAMNTKSYVAEEEFAVIETNLYEARNDKLVWSASSETDMRGPDQARIKTFIGTMVNTMAKYGLLNR